jgi:ABC-type multidrug transport system fused ATPase/permease subunit
VTPVDEVVGGNDDSVVVGQDDSVVVGQDDSVVVGHGVLRRGIVVLWRAIRTHPLPFAVSVTGATLFATMSVGATIVLGHVTDELIIPGFRTRATGTAIRGAVLAILIVALLRAIGVIGRRYYGGVTSYRMGRTWRTRIAGTYLSAPLSFHHTRPTGELMAHADIDTLGATEAINPVPFSTSAIVIAVIAVIRLAMVDPVLTLIGVVLFPLLGLANHVYTKHVEEPAALVQARFGDLASVAHESFDGALVVKTLGLGDHERDRLAAAADRLREQRLRVGYLRAAFEPALDALPNLGTIALLGVGTWRLSQGAVTTGGLVQAMALFAILTLPMRVMGYLLESLPRAVVSVRRLDDVIATPPERTPDPAEVTPLPVGPLGVAVDGVDFAYPGGPPVLTGLRFAVRPGEVVALTGATGAGKSTLCSLLAHLMDPTSGHIAVGGVDLTVADPRELRAAVALVFQETFLFADTVRENLTLSEPVPDPTVAWATGIARADDFIAALDRGLDTVIGERGVTLSGGQRQRLALARALLRHPRLLVLDDATSAVDPRIEQQILAGLRRELDMTTVVVAHRVSTIALADRVLFLDEGRLVAEGSHEHLLATVPAYEALIRAYEDADAEEQDEELSA